MSTPQEQIDRLAKFIIENVPGEPSKNQGAVDTAIRLIARHVMDREVPVGVQRFWDCKVGPAPHDVPPGGDLPMRQAIERGFYGLFGVYPEVNFSGWGSHLTVSERGVMDDKGPDHPAALINAALPHDG